MLGSSEDDLKILVAKRFVLPFPSGVIVVKHWKVNNLVRKDWYRPSQYIEEKSKLYVKENGSYTEDSGQGEALVNESLTIRQHRLGKVRIGNNSESPIRNTSEKEEIRVERFDGDEDPIEPAEKIPKRTREAYELLLRWAEQERGAKFVNRFKQYKALKSARLIGLKAADLKERWEQMSNEKFWVENGFDWTNVVASFNRKGV